MGLTELERRVLRRVDQNREQTVGLVRDMVRIPSIVGQEGPIQAFMARRLAGMGLAVTSFEPDKSRLLTHPDYVPAPWAYAGRPNVVGVLPGVGTGRSLIINGHVDVVSPEPIEQWQHDPWGGEIVGDRLYGRGAMDMKSGLAAGIAALEAVQAEGLRPQGTVSIQSVVEEEAGGGGTLACLMEGFTADGFANPEPVAQVVIAMAGILYFRVRVTGKTTHAGSAHLGVNAIGKMNKLYDALVALDEERARSRRYPLFEAGWSGRSCHLNLGTYKAGDWPSTVAGFAEMECRISFIPGETQAEIKALVAQRIAEVADQDPWLAEHPPSIEWFGWHADPWVQERAAPFIVCAKGAIEDLLGRVVPFAGAAAGLDTRFAGRFGIPAFCLGPSGGGMHGSDEYVELASVMDTARSLALTIMRWSGVTA
jgi:acetylornithine deacetylase